MFELICSLLVHVGIEVPELRFGLGTRESVVTLLLTQVISNGDVIQSVR